MNSKLILIGLSLLFFSIAGFSGNLPKSFQLIENEYEEFSVVLWQYAIEVEQAEKLANMTGQKTAFVSQIEERITAIDNIKTKSAVDSIKKTTIFFLKETKNTVQKSHNVICTLEKGSMAFGDYQKLSQSKMSFYKAISGLEQNLYKSKLKWVQQLGKKEEYNPIDQQKRLSSSLKKIQFHHRILIADKKIYFEAQLLKRAMFLADSNTFNSVCANISQIAQQGKATLDAIRTIQKGDSLISLSKRNFLFHYLYILEKTSYIKSFFVKLQALDQAQPVFLKIQNKTDGDKAAFQLVLNDYNKSLKKFNSVLIDLKRHEKAYLQEWQDASHYFFEE